MSTKTIDAIASAPAKAIAIYHKHREERIEAGDDATSAHRHGLRMLHHAGWFKGPKGWQAVHDDLRGKVNVREAFQQPDGTFCIYDVDAFYPNAAKGTDEVYDSDRNKRIIANTNAGIQSGGQKPGLLEGHPNMMQAAIGTQLDVHGFGVNWRTSPRGRGWIRCDLIHVDPEYVDRMKKKKLTGLSAGIANDSDKTNERIGHVAMLGGSSQQLAHLPTHDVFHSPYVCFSADATSFFMKGKNTMKMPSKMKDCYSAMAAKFAAYSAAQASFDAGEPGAESKLKQCYADFASAKKAFDVASPDMGPLPEEGPGDAQATMPGAGPQYATLTPGEVSHETFVPEEADLSLTDQHEPQDGKTFAAIAQQFQTEPDTAFAALLDIVQKQRATPTVGHSKLAAQVQRLTVANKALHGKLIRDDFNQFCAGLKSDGYQFEDEFAASMFSIAMESKNPAVALENVKTALRKSPKSESLSSVGSVFAADAASIPSRPRDNAPMSQSDTESILRELGEETGRSFSAEDWKVGSVFADGMKR